MTAEPEILFERRGRAGLVTLNRPQALNALTLDMIRHLHRRLEEWAQDDGVAHVIIRAAGGRAFCAGGDIRQLYDWGKAGDPLVIGFYREEYRLNALIKRYPKPYLALIDGIVMGGGVGVSVHGSHRIGGGRTVFAMPETGIGLFPDVGATYLLPRLPGELGTYLALTGERIAQADTWRSGVLTHAVRSEDFDVLTDALCQADEVDEVLKGFASDPGEAAIPALMPVIDRCFAADSVEEVLSRLEAESGEHADWARATARTIRDKCPTSLKIALRQMREGNKVEFEECMRIEFRIVNRVMRGADFYEGVRAVIIDKDNRPNWRPADLANVTAVDVERFFAPLGRNELELP